MQRRRRLLCGCGDDGEELDEPSGSQLILTDSVLASGETRKTPPPSPMMDGRRRCPIVISRDAGFPKLSVRVDHRLSAGISALKFPGCTTYCTEPVFISSVAKLYSTKPTAIVTEGK